MIGLTSILLGAVALSSVSAAPLAPRAVKKLNQAAFEEAQQRDATATRALSDTEIKTSDGQCLFVDLLSGDFRANLNPVQTAACDGSQGQKWDVITKGKHNDAAGFALIVNTLTQACLDFDGRRQPGDQVHMFSCGGRADGSGKVQSAQLFPFDGKSNTIVLAPKSQNGAVCFTSGARIDQAKCDGSAKQTFTFGAANATAPPPPAQNDDAGAGSGECAPPVIVTQTLTVTAGGADATASCAAPVTVTVSSVKTVTVTAGGETTKAADTTKAAESTKAADTTKAAATGKATATSAAGNNGGILTANPTTPVPVSRAGGTLNPTAAAEANQRDNTATRSFTSVSIKSDNGKCLFIDPTAGDFRQNLIPVALKDCDGSPNTKFDIITSGKHNNIAGSSLIVSSLTQGCLNFDPRRAAGDTVILFSCGGRADGDSQTTDSQTFKISGKGPFALSPDNSKGATCLAPNGDLLDSSNCNNSKGQTFTIV